MSTPTTINDGGSAFPIPYGQVMCNEGKGMSLRAYFAGEVIKGIYASGDLNLRTSAEANLSERSRLAITQADSLIAELNKTQQ